MKAPPIPYNDSERIQELYSYNILNSMPEDDYNNITRLASEICKTKISLISLVDEKRTWYKSSYGADMIETPRNVSFCAHAINTNDELFIVDHPKEDERFHDNPLVIGPSHIKFYAGVPLNSSKGYTLGMLCVVDDVPKKLDDNQKELLRALANQVEKLFELRKDKRELQEKATEINDALSYAKLIQDSVFFDKRETINSCIEEFTFFKPKDIVSGDFYLRQVKDHLNIIAVADCTGHGIPGALLSMICSSQLIQSIFEVNPLTPERVLNYTSELIVSKLRSNQDTGMKDGMDISLCFIDLAMGLLHFSGANNNLWVMRNGALIEIKGDRQSVGWGENKKTFQSHTINIQKEDCIYFFSDGYVDQFGGEKNKKFLIKNLKKIVLNNSHKSLSRQKEIFANIFEEWKGDNEQVDDVLLVGLKIMNL